MEENKNSYTVLVGNYEGKNHLKDLSLDDRVILKQTLKEWNERTWN
jgi:hypothetical protein